MDITLTLSQIKNLTKDQALDLYHKFNLPIPKGSDLEYLRSNLRLIKLGENSYENKIAEQLHSSLSPTNTQGNSRVIEHDYEEIDDFDSTESESVESFRMANPQERLPFFNPGVFSGQVNESVELFVNSFERAAKINAWKQENLKTYLPIYLAGAALDIYENIVRKNQGVTWEELKQEIQKTFSPVESNEIKVMKLNSRIQYPSESVIQYMAEIEKLCSQVDDRMEESKICSHILKGLNPALLQQISMLDNNTLEKLRSNISRYEMSSFLMRQRLGLENIGASGIVSQVPDIERKLESLTQLVQQLQVSRDTVAAERGFEADYDRQRDNSFSRGRNYNRRRD